MLCTQLCLAITNEERCKSISAINPAIIENMLFTKCVPEISCVKAIS